MRKKSLDLLWKIVQGRNRRSLRSEKNFCSIFLKDLKQVCYSPRVVCLTLPYFLGHRSNMTYTFQIGIWLQGWCMKNGFLKQNRFWKHLLITHNYKNVHGSIYAVRLYCCIYIWTKAYMCVVILKYKYSYVMVSVIYCTYMRLLNENIFCLISGCKGPGRRGYRGAPSK
jgi:hypothetical protein